MSPLRCAFFVGLWALMPPAARADEPLPRPQSASPADLYTVSQSRPPEGSFSGRPIERLSPVTIQGDGVRAGNLELGAFYFRAFGQLYRVDAHLGCREGIVHEIALQHGLGDAALDGVEDTLSALVLGIGQLIRHPIRSLAALRELPGALVQLIRNSPEYWERFAAMSRTDQIRESSRILSQMLLLYGTANGLTVQLGRAADALGSLTIPTLRLSGTGELIFATVSVQAGQAATVLSGAPGAVYILHMANVAAGGSGGQSAGNGGEHGPERPQHTDHARKRQTEGRRTGPAFNDAIQARQGDVYLQQDGRYVVRGPRGREHIFEPNGDHLTTFDRSRAAHLRKLQRGERRAVTDREFEQFRRLFQ